MISRESLKLKKYRHKKILTRIGFSLVPAFAAGIIGSLLKPISPAASASNSSLRRPACCSESVGIDNLSANDLIGTLDRLGLIVTEANDFELLETARNIFLKRNVD